MGRKPSTFPHLKQLANTTAVNYNLFMESYRKAKLRIQSMPVQGVPCILTSTCVLLRNNLFRKKNKIQKIILNPRRISVTQVLLPQFIDVYL